MSLFDQPALLWTPEAERLRNLVTDAGDADAEKRPSRRTILIDAPSGMGKSFMTLGLAAHFAQTTAAASNTTPWLTLYLSPTSRWVAGHYGYQPSPHFPLDAPTAARLEAEQRPHGDPDAEAAPPLSGDRPGLLYDQPQLALEILACLRAQNDADVLAKVRTDNDDLHDMGMIRPCMTL